MAVYRGTNVRRWYRGVTYDSLLELAWKLQLDELGVVHEYHHEHVALAKGWWEPDFTLWDEGGAKYWLEVKGDHGERVEKAEEAAISHPGRVILGTGRVFSEEDEYGSGAVGWFYALHWRPFVKYDLGILLALEGWDGRAKRRVQNEKLRAEGGWGLILAGKGEPQPSFRTWPIHLLERMT